MATLDSVTACLLIDASLCAYDVYDSANPGVCRTAVTPPPGYSVAGTFTGVDSVLFGWEDDLECYGVVFASDGDAGRSCIFSFRGTDTKVDALLELGDATATTPFVPFGGARRGDASVVESFWSIYSTPKGTTPSMQSQVFALLEKLQPIDRIYVTGHSLGAALAVLFTLDLALSSYGSTPYLNRNYACPRVGDSGFVALYEAQPAEKDPSRRTVRVQNTYDLVPCVPPEAAGFAHVGDALLVAFYDKNWSWLHPLEAKYEAHSALNHQAVLDCALAAGGVCESSDLYVPATKKHLVSKTPDPSTVCRVSWDSLVAAAEAAGPDAPPPTV
jgi:triacylglycerol lipase